METVSPSPLTFEHDQYRRIFLTRAAGEKMEKATVAANIGSDVWLHAKINGIDRSTMRLHDRTIEIASTRSGVIGVPENYLASFDPNDKMSPSVRQIFRQATLVHEARHSDCTGGLRQGTLEAAREAFSYSDFSRAADPSCSHMHSLCAMGDYLGLPACDSHAWGSYPAGELFLQAALGRPDLTDKDRHVLRSIIKDIRSRVAADHSAMMRGELGRPDARHSDALVPDASQRGNG